MTKTIPIWCCVLNRAIARKRAEQQAAAERARAAAPSPHLQPSSNIPDPLAQPPAAPCPSCPVPVPSSTWPSPARTRCCSLGSGAAPGAGGGAGGTPDTCQTRVGSLSSWLERSGVAVGAGSGGSAGAGEGLGGCAEERGMGGLAAGDGAAAAAPAAAAAAGCGVPQMPNGVTWGHGSAQGHGHRHGLMTPPPPSTAEEMSGGEEQQQQQPHGEHGAAACGTAAGRQPPCIPAAPVWWTAADAIGSEAGPPATAGAGAADSRPGVLPSTDSLPEEGCPLALLLEPSHSLDSHAGSSCCSSPGVGPSTAQASEGGSGRGSACGYGCAPGCSSTDGSCCSSGSGGSGRCGSSGGGADVDMSEAPATEGGGSSSNFGIGVHTEGWGACHTEVDLCCAAGPCGSPDEGWRRIFGTTTRGAAAARGVAGRAALAPAGPHTGVELGPQRPSYAETGTDLEGAGDCLAAGLRTCATAITAGLQGKACSASGATPSACPHPHSLRTDSPLHPSPGLHPLPSPPAGPSSPHHTVPIASTTDSPCTPADGTDPWDTSLHLPLWVSQHERVGIEARLEGFVDSLLRVGADVEGLAAALRKPLRPLWLSQASTIWVDQVAQPEQLPFTPVILVSASQPHSYTRQAGGVTAVDVTVVGGRTGRTGAGGKVALEEDEDGCGGGSGGCSWTYVYVPGAGDDEESWAAGLTPAVFWAHHQELLQAGPAGVYDAVRHVLEREAAALAQHGVNSTTTAAAALTLTQLASGGGCVAQGNSGGVAGAGYVAATDAHHLLPAGCRPGAAAGAAAVTATGTGVYYIGGTGIALGDMAAGAAPGVWEHVGAVLCVGLQPHPSMAGERQWPVEAVAAQAAATQAAGAAGTGGEGCGSRDQCGGERGRRVEGEGRLGMEHESGDDTGPVDGLPGNGGGSGGAAELLGCGSAAAAAEGDGCLCGGSGPGVVAACHRPAQGDGEAVAGTAHVDHRSHAHHIHSNKHHHQHHQHHHHAPRYLHLPVQHFKFSRSGLAQQLDAALRFASHHLARGRTVLIHDANGAWAEEWLWAGAWGAGGVGRVVWRLGHSSHLGLGLSHKRTDGRCAAQGCIPSAFVSVRLLDVAWRRQGMALVCKSWLVVHAYLRPPLTLLGRYPRPAYPSSPKVPTRACVWLWRCCWRATPRPPAAKRPRGCGRTGVWTPPRGPARWPLVRRLYGSGWRSSAAATRPGGPRAACCARCSTISWWRRGRGRARTRARRRIEAGWAGRHVACSEGLGGHAGQQTASRRLRWRRSPVSACVRAPAS